MEKKRFTTAIILLFCILTASAQTSLSFTPAEWDFGSIREADGRVSHTFTGVNTSDKPVVILDIFTSCGCTVPEFSKKPVLPGEKTEVKVTFDPANRPGTFIKELTIIDAGHRKAGRLTVRGQVIERKRTVEERYPVDAGSGVRLSQSLCAFSFVCHDRIAMTAVELINTTGRSVRLELRPEEESGFLLLDYPQELSAGARGEIRVGYNIPAESGRYGTVKDVLRLRIDGRESSIPLMAHGIAVDNPHLSNEICRPKAEIDKYILKFGVLKRGSGLHKLPVTVSNKGESTLVIRAAEVGEGIGCTLRTGRKIEPGRSATAYVTIDPANQEYGPLTGYLTVITNDPANPLRKVRVTAVIEE